MTLENSLARSRASGELRVRDPVEARAIPGSLARIYPLGESSREIESLSVKGVSEHWNLRCLVHLMGKVL